MRVLLLSQAGNIKQLLQVIPFNKWGFSFFPAQVHEKPWRHIGFQCNYWGFQKESMQLDTKTQSYNTNSDHFITLETTTHATKLRATCNCMCQSVAFLMWLRINCMVCLMTGPFHTVPLHATGKPQLQVAFKVYSKVNPLGRATLLGENQPQDLRNATWRWSAPTYNSGHLKFAQMDRRNVTHMSPPCSLHRWA